MKRLRAIARAADAEFRLVREGGNHEIWTMGGGRLVIPRHGEINELTAQGIIKKAREITTDET